MEHQKKFFEVNMPLQLFIIVIAQRVILELSICFSFLKITQIVHIIKKGNTHMKKIFRTSCNFSHQQKLLL